MPSLKPLLRSVAHERPGSPGEKRVRHGPTSAAASQADDHSSGKIDVLANHRRRQNSIHEHGRVDRRIAVFPEPKTPVVSVPLEDQVGWGVVTPADPLRKSPGVPTQWTRTTHPRFSRNARGAVDAPSPIETMATGVRGAKNSVSTGRHMWPTPSPWILDRSGPDARGFDGQACSSLAGRPTNSPDRTSPGIIC